MTDLATLTTEDLLALAKSVDAERQRRREVIASELDALGGKPRKRSKATTERKPRSNAKDSKAPTLHPSSTAT
jgi:hypothetical protein